MISAYKKNILKNIKRLDKILNYLLDEDSYRNSQVKMKQIERFINLFDTTNELINEHSNSEKYINFEEKLSTLLSEAVDPLSEKSNEQLVTLLNKIKKAFIEWENEVVSNVKYQIVIFGINQLTFQIKNIIDTKKTNILFIIDDSGSNNGKTIDEFPVVELKEVSNVKIDYFVNFSSNKEIVNQIKYSNFLPSDTFVDYISYKMLIPNNSPEFTLNIDSFFKSDKKYSGILTGLSYIQKGVNANSLQGNFFNFANPAQDLYYDFKMFKYAMRYEEIQKNIKHAIIGLSYYSFHYDLSKSVEKNRVNYYYPYVKSMHNHPYKNELTINHMKLEELEESIFKEHHLINAFQPEKEYFIHRIKESYLSEYNSLERDDEELLQDINSIKQVFNKNYPETVKENIQILMDYLEFLEANSIKPVIIVCPKTKLFQTFTPVHFKKEVYEIINDLQKRYKFQFIDYFDSPEFVDSDFYDPSHINQKGSIKLAKILNTDIMW